MLKYEVEQALVVPHAPADRSVLLTCQLVVVQAVRIIFELAQIIWFYTPLDNSV